MTVPKLLLTIVGVSIIVGYFIHHHAVYQEHVAQCMVDIEMDQFNDRSNWCASRGKDNSCTLSKKEQAKEDAGFKAEAAICHIVV